MKIDQIKFVLHRHMRLSYGVTLTQAQLDDIHDFYHDMRKQALKQLIYYRFVNMMLGVVFSILFVIFDESWFACIIFTIFMFYNMIHGILQWIQYKRIKEPIRPSDG